MFGLKDLQIFERALRLGWLWNEWAEPKKNDELPCDESDRQLFATSTVVVLGDGNKAKFWHSRWIGAEAPKVLAPSLFTLVKRKKKSVAKELINGG